MGKLPTTGKRVLFLLTVSIGLIAGGVTLRSLGKRKEKANEQD